MESLKTDSGRALLWPATSRVVGEDNTLNHLLSQLYSEFCEVLLFWKVFIISEMQEFGKKDKSFERNYFRKERSVQEFTDAPVGSQIWFLHLGHEDT